MKECTIGLSLHSPSAFLGLNKLVRFLVFHSCWSLPDQQLRVLFLADGGLGMCWTIKEKLVFCLISGDSNNSALCVHHVCEGEAHDEIDFCLSCKENSGWVIRFQQRTEHCLKKAWESMATAKSDMGAGGEGVQGREANLNCCYSANAGAKDAAVLPIFN